MSMSASTCDVFVVGGGGAGLTAGIATAQCGLSVTVADALQTRRAISSICSAQRSSWERTFWCIHAPTGWPMALLSGSL